MDELQRQVVTVHHELIKVRLRGAARGVIIAEEVDEVRLEIHGDFCYVPPLDGGCCVWVEYDTECCA